MTSFSLVPLEGRAPCWLGARNTVSLITEPSQHRTLKDCNLHKSTLVHNVFAFVC
uniref:Uncharacterized protein n=1 Tax=Anguilla anguilla TaxID=7936 RepID=A0A0E9TF53_ANGAN